jgi:hypothetical protein
VEKTIHFSIFFQKKFQKKNIESKKVKKHTHLHKKGSDNLNSNHSNESHKIRLKALQHSVTGSAFFDKKEN